MLKINKTFYISFLERKPLLFINLSKQPTNKIKVSGKIFEDIEERWNKGQYGKDWEECKDSKIKEEWNLHTNQGLSKIFSIRKSYSDRFFIEHFLTEKLVEDLQLYLKEK